MSADDSFFNPRGARAPLYLPRPPTGDESDVSADATFFGRHHPEEPEEGAEEGLTADSRAEVEAYRQQVRAEGREDEDEDEYYDEGAEETFSEGSSAVFDADNDPAGFAERLDELAGVLEVREDEARAVRWGPDLSGGGECWLEGG
jgi:hypothetical protein